MGENAEIVRRAYDLFNQGDVDGFLALMDPAVEFHDVPEIPDSGVYSGHDGIRRWYAKLQDVSEDLRFSIWEMEERGASVLADTGADMHGASSGVEIGWRFWTLWRVHDGLITYHHGYSEAAEARAAFEQTGP
jgi:ketosteroid isomerase-like protein